MLGLRQIVDLISEIDLGFHQAQPPQNGRPHLAHPVGKSSVKMLGGQSGLAPGSTFDQVEDRFGLGQVELPIHKGPLGKLAGLS